MFGYTGQEWDQDAKLQNNNARWYDPQTGRFLSVDPSGLADDPNPYRYVGNSPLNATDPTGLYQAGNPLSSLSFPSISSSLSSYVSPGFSTLPSIGSLDSLNRSLTGGSDYSKLSDSFAYFQRNDFLSSLVTPPYYGLSAQQLDRAASAKALHDQTSLIASMELGAMSQINDPVMAILGNSRVQGGLRAAAGTGQIIAALGAAEIPVVGPFITAAVGIRGFDNLTAGVSQLVTGNPTQTKTGGLLNSGVQSLGANPRVAAKISSLLENSFDSMTGVLAPEMPGIRPVRTPIIESLPAAVPRTSNQFVLGKSSAVTYPLGTAEEQIAAFHVQQRINQGLLLGAPSSIPSQLTAGQAWEAERLGALNLSKNTEIWRPTLEQTKSSAFRVIVGEPKFTRGGLLRGTILDATEGGLLEIKGGTSTLGSSYQLRLQTYRSLIENRPLKIETIRPVNPTFQDWLQRWGVQVQRPQ